MIELISLLGGAIARLIPMGAEVYKQKKEEDHEYRMTQLQLEIDKARATQQIDLVHAQAAIASDAADMKALADTVLAQARPTGIPWVDAINSTVRPFLTYYHLIFVYTLIKVAMFYISYRGGLDWASSLSSIYTEEDRALAWSMASFWFVDRSIRKPK